MACPWDLIMVALDGFMEKFRKLKPEYKDGNWYFFYSAIGGRLLSVVRANLSLPERLESQLLWCRKLHGGFHNFVWISLPRSRRESACFHVQWLCQSSERSTFLLFLYSDSWTFSRFKASTYQNCFHHLVMVFSPFGGQLNRMLPFNFLLKGPDQCKFGGPRSRAPLFTDCEHVWLEIPVLVALQPTLCFVFFGPSVNCTNSAPSSFL